MEVAEEMEDTIAIVLVEEDAEALATATTEAEVVTTGIGMIGEHLRILDINEGEVLKLIDRRTFIIV